MLTIPVRVCGDNWTNPEEVHSLLSKAAGKETVVLDLQAEGPSLRKLHISRAIDLYCARYSISQEKIYIVNWSNASEIVPYTVSNLHLRSHFFGRSHQYWIDQLPESTHRCVFGFFIGRKTIPRSVIMYYLWHNYRKQVLLSSMETRIPLPWINEPLGYNFEKIKDWSKQIDYREFCSWWSDNPIGSLDNRFVHDQYNPDHNTNRSLLSFYPTFNIEIVAESYTLGDTFFPTEKTVRPLMAAKPILVYGPIGFLKGLKKLGFETYDNLWSEEYDNYEYVDRWLLLKKTIDSIMLMSTEDRLAMLAKANEIALRNRQHLDMIRKTGPR